MSGLEAQIQLSHPLALSVDLRVGPGEILALVGRSGAGKSTLLKALAGLVPASGQIEVNGRAWLAPGFRLPPHQRRIGYLFQAYALFPHKTALENLMLAQGADQNAQEAEALLTAVELQGLGHRRPHQLSGGQQQRVALARALARKPELLLLDEPFSATDRSTRRALARTLHGLRQTLAMPTLLVSHDIEDVARLADRIAVLEDGCIAQIGPTAEVLANPASEAIAELIR